MELNNDILYLKDISQIKYLSEPQIEYCIDHYWHNFKKWNTHLLVGVLSVLNKQYQTRLLWFITHSDILLNNKKFECNKELALYIKNFLCNNGLTSIMVTARGQQNRFYQLSKFIEPYITNEELLDLMVFALKDYRDVVLWFIDRNCWDRFNEKQIKHLKFLYELSK